MCAREGGDGGGGGGGLQIRLILGFQSNFAYKLISGISDNQNLLIY